jgi:hypothetical protein
MVVRSEAYVCDLLIAGIAGSNPFEIVDIRLLCLLYGVCSGFCDELFTHSKESYRICVCVCVCVCL